MECGSPSRSAWCCWGCSINPHGRPSQIWYQNHSNYQTGMQVIEGARTGNVPFGFARALVEDQPRPTEDDIYKVFGGAYGA